MFDGFLIALTNLLILNEWEDGLGSEVFGLHKFGSHAVPFV